MKVRSVGYISYTWILPLVYIVEEEYVLFAILLSASILSSDSMSSDASEFELLLTSSPGSA